MRDEHQNTLLHTACEVRRCARLCAYRSHLWLKAGHLFIVNFLFECGARIHVVNAAGETPIQAAQRAGHHEIARMLLEEDEREKYSGCRMLRNLIVCPVSYSLGTIHRACASGRILSTLRFLLTVPGCNVPNQEGHTPMFLAVNNNQPLVLSVLLEAGVW